MIVERTDEPAPHLFQRLQLDLLGADRPGIVSEISAVLADAQVSIEELSTNVRDAPMAGGTLFEARAVLSAPLGGDTDALRDVLEALADELMVELRLSDVRAPWPGPCRCGAGCRARSARAGTRCRTRGRCRRRCRGRRW